MLDKTLLWDTWKGLLLNADKSEVAAAESFRRQLQNLSFTPSELVVLKSDFSIFFGVAYLTLLEMGAVPVVTAGESASSEMLDKIRYYVEGAQVIHALGGPQISEYQDCFATFSSGSTGVPKIFYHGIEAAVRNATLHAESLRICRDHLIFQTLPMSHIFGLVAYIWTPLVTGANVFLASEFLGLRDFAEKFPKGRHVIHLIPSQVEVLRKDRYSYERIFEKITVGAGLLGGASLEFLQQNLCKEVYITYGMTEAGPRISYKRVSSDSFVEYSLGHALQGIQLKVLREDQLCSSGEGYLAIQTPCLALNLRTETKDGYFVTTDRVMLTEEKEIIFRGRDMDLLKISGLLVSRLVLEEKIRSAIDTIDDIYIAQILEDGRESCLVFLQANSDPDNIRNKILEVFPTLREKVKTIMVQKIPRTLLGKVDRSKILAEYNETKGPKI